MDEIEIRDENHAHWARYQKKYDYAADINFSDVMCAVRKLVSAISTKRINYDASSTLATSALQNAQAMAAD